MDKMDLKDRIYDEMLSDIVNLRYKPGDFVKEVELSKRFHVSRTPMREVIKKLAVEGYIDVLPRYGNRISLISISSVKQILEMRIVLENQVIDELRRKITDEQLGKLREHIEKQQELVDCGNLESFWQSDNDFHRMLFELAGREFWWDVIRRYEPHYMRFRKFDLQINRNVDLLFVHHKKIIEMISDTADCDIKGLVQSHISVGLERIPVLLEKCPQYFTD